MAERDAENSDLPDAESGDQHHGTPLSSESSQEKELAADNKTLPGRKPDFFNQPPDEQLILAAKRNLSWRFRSLRARSARPVYTDQDWKDVDTIFRVKRRRFFEILDEHQRYEEEHCRDAADFDAASAAYFINNPGRPRGSILPEPQKKAIFLGIFDRYRNSVVSTGERIPRVPLPEEIDRRDVFKYARSMQPALTPKKVNREIDLLLSGDSAALILYAVYGEEWAREHLVPKKDTTPPEINWWWLYDDLHPKFYLNHKGLAVKAVLLWGMEWISDYILGIRVVPKIDFNPDGSPRKVSYTKEDFGILLATSIVRARCLSRYLYNDNASAFTALIEILRLITETGHEPFEMTNSFPGRPWPRKIESRHGQLRDFIEQYPGAYWDRESEKKAQENPAALWTAERWTQELEAYRHEINTEHLPDKRRKDQTRPSREEVWKSVIPRPAPPIRRLVSLPYPVPPIQKSVRMYHFGFHFDYDVYVPICDDHETRKHLYRIWMNAAARTLEGNVEFPICAIKLDIVGWQVEIMLADGEWFRAVPKKEQNISEEEHEAAKKGTLNAMKEELVQKLTAISEEVRQEAGGLPERVNIKRDYRVAKEPTTPTGTEGVPSTAKKPRKKAKGNTTTNNTGSRTPLDINPDDFADLEDLMDQLE
ncbi:hypothetical protein K2Z83_24725 [Oscillochloris sp. ZM17-4]|uniref:hypothetical protein n=1 Tax=Oscillochloris sp. ZM17-4 TaxID=2866714 RepID=UPI001C736958|nr:hypothetical protein [Oscillochloris sp. ZM17-4]MBX0330865.1 hypothetical protein [Oscillochloris sp. ZM17-4]